MALRDRCVSNPLRWWPVSFTWGWISGYRRGRAHGHAEGRLEAWEEANEMIRGHRMRYDPKPISEREARRRRRLFGGA